VPIAELAAGLALEPHEVQPYGGFAAKLELSALDRLRDEPDGKLISVTSMTPTKFGEGKTTTAISLVEALGRIGERTVLCLRAAAPAAGAHSSCRWSRSTCTSPATSTRSAPPTTCSRP
jgi:formate--tetrahydrofolate ligase